MIKHMWMMICILFSSLSLFAQTPPPLRVAVSRFLPPFVMQAADQKLTGFDILLVTQLCQEIHRSCRFIPMPTGELIPALMNNVADLAISNLVITPYRAEVVNFSIPYMLSESRFITTQQIAAQPFDINQLQNRTLGVEKGTALREELLAMKGMTNNVTSFDSIDDVISALQDGSIDFALMSNPIALYWENHSSGALHTVGQPISYGLGVGVAINKNDPLLEKAINMAILLVQEQEEYKQIYRMYFGGI